MIRLESPAFADQSTLPRQFTCDGRGTSPPLSWSGVPSGTRSLILLLEDPDAPGGTFLHWSVYAMPSKTSKLAAGQVPAGVEQGRNSFGKVGYGPPCPPRGDRAHRYVFTLFAIPRSARVPGGADVTALRRVASTARATGVLTTRYRR